ncbi:MAG: ribonuclease Y [Demequina sp.]
MEQSIVVIGLLGACLVALLLVHFARRDAAAERESAREQAEDMREQARALTTEATLRYEQVVEREKELTRDQRTAQEYARQLDERVAALAAAQKRIEDDREALDKEHREAMAALAETDPEQARKQLLEQLTQRARTDAAGELRRIGKRLRADADRTAQQILVDAMQRQVGETTAQNSVTWVDLPSDEMKGRIIGREGRNIRAFEAITGVNVILDEGVTAVQLSSFDVERREIAHATLQTLIEDGRIQPQRIESAYATAVAAAGERHFHAGLDAVDTVGVRGLPEPMVEALGRLRLRTSYGQHVLAHLVEAAQIAFDIATEMGADPLMARRAALLHDVGKAFTHERSGTHAQIGAEFAAEHGEAAEVVNAIAAHHDEVEQETIEAVIVQIADAVSASRPGARRDDVDSYIERMGNLETLLGDHAGVSKVLVMAAGREVRVIVEPDQIDDDGTHALARTIAERINAEFTIPGEIKVTVIRELRAETHAGDV